MQRPTARRHGLRPAGGGLGPKAAAAGALLCLWSLAAAAQELSPRFYWPAPVGTKLAVFGYSYSEGDVLMDPSLPIYGVDSHLNNAFVGYLQTFELWGRTANVLVELPYVWGRTEGFLFGLPARRDYSGYGDGAVTVAVNLLGAPAMTPQEFFQLDRYPPKLLGASLRIVPPSGEYDPSRLINVGANRWAAKAEIGSVIPLRGHLLLELEAGVWYFGDDHEFIGGRREQDPLIAAEVHLVRRFRSGFWTSLDANYFTGGRSTIAGVLRPDLQRNSKIGGVVVIPFKRRYSVKLGYSAGVITEIGGDFQQFLVSYQVLLNRRRK